MHSPVGGRRRDAPVRLTCARDRDSRAAVVEARAARLTWANAVRFRRRSARSPLSFVFGERRRHRRRRRRCHHQRRLGGLCAPSEFRHHFYAAVLFPFGFTAQTSLNPFVRAPTLFSDGETMWKSAECQVGASELHLCYTVLACFVYFLLHV